MILESLQDIVEGKSWSASLGLSFDSVKNLKGVNGYSIGGSDARHNKHVVARLSGLIGEEEARVVIAGALHLNGAMIGAAHRDENGVYTDHGNLVLKVGELFWQHIYDYDNGHTLGISYSKSLGKKAESEGQAKGKDIWNLGGAVGGHDKDGLTKATIGLGDVTIAGSSEIPDGVNRDVSAVQEMETNYDVQTIKPYFTNQDIETLVDGLIRKEDGSFDLGATISSIGEHAYQTVAVPLSEAVEYLFPEEKPEISDEEYVSRFVKASGLGEQEAEEEIDDNAEDKEIEKEEKYETPFVNPYYSMLVYASFSKQKSSEKSNEISDDDLIAKVIEPLEMVERRHNKIYLDSRGIPTVGVGSALISNDGKNWKKLPDEDLKAKNIHLSDKEKDAINEIAILLNKKISGKEIKRLYNERIKQFEFKIDDSLLNSIRDKDIKDHIDRAKKKFDSSWNELKSYEKAAIVMYTFHHGNANALKKAYEKGGAEAVHNIMKNSDGHRGVLQARLFDKGVLCSEGKYCVMPYDTAGKIAKKVSDDIKRAFSVDSLIKLNPQISDFDKLYVGQELNVPTPHDEEA